MEKPQPRSLLLTESQSDLRLGLLWEWLCQLLLIMMLLALSLTVNQVFHAAFSLRRYLGGLPWFGWAGMIGLLAVAGALFALRDSWRARRLLEDPPEKHVDTNKQKLTEEEAKYDANGPDYPHPVIIDHRCIGCEACVKACPHDVLTMVGGIAKVTARDQCMEDTSCQAVCPVSPEPACIVVHAPKPKPRPFPKCTDKFMSQQVSGCYIIGDVSGRRLIKNAAKEGAEVIEHIAEELESPKRPIEHRDDEYDVAIIGIGPAGLSAAIRAKRLNLKYVAIEKDKMLSTLAAYPKDKDILFRPENWEVCSDIPFTVSSDKCEKIVEAWDQTRKSHQVEIHEVEGCTAVTKPEGDDYFKIETENGENKEQFTYRALRVVLAVGLRGTPMTLGGPGGKSLPGETKFSDRVRYSSSKLEGLKGKRVLIVGGGNSAVEAALALAPQSNGAKQKPALISLAVRSGFTNDLVFASKQKLYEYTDKGEINLYWETAVKAICEGTVVLKEQQKNQDTVVPNDYVLALIGGDFPTDFLKKIGITISSERRGESFLQKTFSWVAGLFKRDPCKS